MKRKRILALAAAVFLLLLYASSLIFALTDNPLTESLLAASLFCTIAIPVLIYGYIIVYRALKGRGADRDKRENSSGGRAL